MRNAVNQASSAYNQANTTASTLGGEGQAIGANLTPFLTQEMLHPQGIGQQGITAETSAALGGAGGAMSAFNGEAAQRAGASRNAGGFQAALDDASRQRMKAAAGASEGIQANNENLKQTQQQEGAHGLQGMYGTDTSGMLNSQGQEAGDVNAEANANNTGWFQNAMKVWDEANKSGEVVANIMCPAKGSLYLMADGSKKAVEELCAGELILGIDGEPETIEAIESAYSPIVRTETDDGFVSRTSRVHAFALPMGGFILAPRALNKKIRSAGGVSCVASSSDDGVDLVFNVITDGSHTYEADGLWGVGVGEAERHVSMEDWAKIGNKIKTEVS